jgi:DNA replication initiation complex subunit (GINS family)
LIETEADRLHRLLADENSSKELLKIPPDTYKRIASHIKGIRAESSDGDHSLSSELSFAERKILFDIARRLIEVRIAKFGQDPEADLSRLTMEEKYVVEPLIQSRKRFDKIGESIFNGQTGELEHAASLVKQKYVYVRFVQPYAAITGSDMGTYGPFEPEDVAIVPVDNAKLLVKNGIVSRNWIEPEER